MPDSELDVQGLAVSELARRFGTPLFVYDATVLDDTYRQLRGLLPSAMGIYLSLKANPNVSVAGYLGSLGAGAEVSSLAELRIARWAGIPLDRTIFLGPGKNGDELRACVTSGLRATVCESFDEAQALDTIAAELGVDEVPALLRVNPDFQAKGSGLSMGGKPRQFGIDAEQVRRSRNLLGRLRRVRFLGVHVYMGTQILDPAVLVDNARQVLALADGLSAQLDVPLEMVDVGGGLGIAYFDNQHDFDVEALAAGLEGVLAPFAAAHPQCHVVTELGRYLTALCGRYVVRALYVKESMGESFVVADGGTNHHMPAVGVGTFVKRNFPIRSLTRYGDDPTRTYTVTGPLCTPSDILGKDIRLPPVDPGDLLGVERSGAYGPSASPGLFLSHGFPAEVLVLDGAAHLVRERDSVDDILRKQRLINLTTQGRTPSNGTAGHPTRGGHRAR